MGRAFSLTLPVSWQRADLRRYSTVECERLSRAAFEAVPGRDSREVALARRRFKEVLLAPVTRARAIGALDLYFSPGSSRTGIGPMSLMSFVDSADEPEPASATALLRLGLPTTSIDVVEFRGTTWSRSIQRTSKTVDEWSSVLLEGTARGVTADAAGSTDTLSQGSVHYSTGIPDSPGAFLVLSGSTLGTSLLGSQIAHLDSIVRTFSWTD